MGLGTKVMFHMTLINMTALTYYAGIIPQCYSEGRASGSGYPIPLREQNQSVKTVKINILENSLLL